MAEDALDVLCDERTRLRSYCAVRDALLATVAGDDADLAAKGLACMRRAVERATGADRLRRCFMRLNFRREAPEEDMWRPFRISENIMVLGDRRVNIPASLPAAPAPHYHAKRVRRVNVPSSLCRARSPERKIEGENARRRRSSCSSVEDELMFEIEV